MSVLPEPRELLQELIRLPGPPGQEDAVREAVARHVTTLGLDSRTDAKGNLIVELDGEADTPVLVTAHLDEIAMQVREIDPDGTLRVIPMGGLYPFKLGEGPVLVLGDPPMDALMSIGSIHTAAAGAAAVQATKGPLTWEMVRVVTGQGQMGPIHHKVAVGTRVVVHPSRRELRTLGKWVSGYFLDDRADLVSWLLALERLKDSGVRCTFAATVSEEVGGEGALFLMRREAFDVCVALEIGPSVVDAPVELGAWPTLWTSDSFATSSAADLRFVASVADEAKIPLQRQALSRGGSDASCAAAQGLCARPITLGLPVGNSHGWEIMHPGAMAKLADLTVALVPRLARAG